MKGFFKLTTAALALVAFASCSNDDLFGNGQATADGQAEGALQMETEQLIDGVTTRAAYVPNGAANQLFWEQDDQILVFDGALLKYDTYEFSEKRGTFENNYADNVKTPEFAFTTEAKSKLTKQKWFNDLNQVAVTYTIASTPKSGLNDKIASTKGNKVRAYKFSLPMWGEATKTDAGVKVSMKYLTSVLRVELGQLPADKPQVRITAWADQAMATPAPITGEFKAVLSEDDEVIEDAQLVEPTAQDGVRFGGLTPTGNTITLDFSELDAEEWNQIRANGGFVYIPLISQYYGALKFEYRVNSTAPWIFFKKTKPFTAKRATVYRMNIEELEIAGSDAESVNALLVKQKDTEGDVTVNTTFATDLKAGKNVIIIPAGMKASSLTLNLTGINGNSNPFEIESEDGKFEGDVILDLGDGAVTSLPAIYLNLPNSNVILKGDYKGANLGVTGTSQDKLIVKSLTIAPISEDEADRGFTATNVGSIWPNYESFKGGVEPGIYVQENTTVIGNIDLDKANENKDAIVGNTSIKIEGTVREITPGDGTGYVYAYVKDPNYTSAPKDKKYMFSDIPVTVGKKASVNKIKTASDITIIDEAIIVTKAESCFGNITFSSSSTTASGALVASGKEDGLENSGNVTMTSGLATTVQAKVKADLSGEASAGNATAAEVALSEKASVTTLATATTLSIVGTAWAQAATMNADGTATINLSAEGEAIKGTFAVNNAAITLTQGYINTISKTAATGKKAELTFGEGEGFTAIGSFTGTGDFEFKNASTWNGKKINADKFAAYNTTSTNYIYTAVQLASNPYSAAWLALGNDIDLNNEAWTPLKLQTSFSGVGTGKTIKNLKVTGADDKGTGLFASIESTGTPQIANLTIDGGEIAAAGKSNVGVIAGLATADVVVKNVTIKSATVTGKYNVGGLIGNSKGIDITNADVAGVTLANPDALAKEPAMSATTDNKAGSFGRYVGYLGGNFKADKDAAGILDIKALGFWANLRKNAGNGYFYYPGTVNCGLFDVAITSYQVGSTSIAPSNIYSQGFIGTAHLKADKASAAGNLGCYVEANEWKK